MAHVDAGDDAVLRRVMGPSPWALPREFEVAGRTYRFVTTAPVDSTLGGMICLQDGSGNALLFLDYYCYVQLAEDGSALVWRPPRGDARPRIAFDCFSILTLRPVSHSIEAAAEIRGMRFGVGPLENSEHWEMNLHSAAGWHGIGVPYDWSRFGETLVVADHMEGTAEHAGRAIFAFDWSKREVEVLPQDWFNGGGYDLGHQWITRVGRRRDGTIIGDGMRLGRFELDRTGRRVRRWMVEDHFHRIGY